MCTFKWKKGDPSQEILPEGGNPDLILHRKSPAEIREILH